MAKEPMLLSQGTAELLRVTTPEQIAIMGITSRSYPEYIDDVIEIFEKELKATIPTERRFSYTPPNNVGCDYRISIDSTSRMVFKYEDKEPRVESIPEITNPNLTYVIFDDIFEKGHTLNRTINRLVEKGVKEEGIWFGVNLVIDLFGGDNRPYLDKPHTFFDYIEDLERERKAEFRAMVETLKRVQGF